MTNIHLMRPEWLWTLIPAALLLLLLWRMRTRKGSWQSVIEPQLLRHLAGDTAVARTLNLLPLLLLGWILAAIAASGPSWQKLPQPIHQKQDGLIVLLDLSYSMKSADLPPSRLDRARQKVIDLLAARNEGQTGLVAYAGDAHIVTPLTDDTATIANLIPALNPDMMPVPGSDPASAITLASELLHSAGIRAGTLLLLTDGIPPQAEESVKDALSRFDGTLNILGVGTPTGAPIPLPDGGFLKDRNGAIVMPGLRDDNLAAIAHGTGGDYQRIRLDDSDLKATLSESPVGSLEETLSLDRTADTWEDQGYLFILLLLPLALSLFRRGWVVAILPLLLLVDPQPASASVWDDLWLTGDQQGKRALTEGNPEKAASLFDSPEWTGTAFYRSGDYEKAIEHFSDSDSADSLYNRGNALAREGKFDEAIAAYEESLQIAPDQEDATENIELLKKLKDQQQPEQNQSSEQQNPSSEQQDPSSEQQDPSSGQQDPSSGQQDPSSEQQDPSSGQQDPSSGQQDPSAGQQDPSSEQQDPSSEQQAPSAGQQDPASGQQDPSSEQSPLSEQKSTTNKGSPESTDEEHQETHTATSNSNDKEDQQAPRQNGTESADRRGDEELDQAMEQWLRRVPDDPSGLLREKFRYESQQRRQEGAGRNNDIYW